MYMENECSDRLVLQSISTQDKQHRSYLSKNSAANTVELI